MPMMSSTTATRSEGSSSSLLLATVRRLIRVGSTEEVVGLLMDAVRDLGGSVATANHRSMNALDFDISFGTGEPLFADADEPAVLSLLRAVLPPLLADATLSVERIQRDPAVMPSDATDPMTGLGNWSFTMRVLDRMMSGDAIAIMEIENLKHINSYFGTATGDQVILSFARTLRRVSRAADTVGRVGGTEFVWLFRNSSPAGVESALNRLRSVWEADRPHDVTFAAGLAVVGPTGPVEGYMHADLAVQDAKRSGTNLTRAAG